MPRVAGQIDLAKTEAILEAASAVFSARGLSAPMEEVARCAGVSKQTIYNHFGGKAELVRAIVTQRVEGITAPLRVPGADERPQETLAAYGRALLHLILRNYDLMRVTVRSAPEMPELAREVFETGPRASRRRLAEFIAREMDQGRIDRADPLRAAEFFAGMVIGQHQTQALLGIAADLSDDEIAALAEAAADRFMRAYAPREG